MFPNSHRSYGMDSDHALSQSVQAEVHSPTHRREELPPASPFAGIDYSTTPSRASGHQGRQESTLSRFRRLFTRGDGHGKSSETASSSHTECANIDHQQWDILAPSLRKYVQARMQKALAQERNFGAEHLAAQQGICRGMGSVWLRLHQAKPKAKAASRMALLMSESGTAHATIAHRLYANENVYRDTGNAPSLQHLLDAGCEAQFDTEVCNLSTMYATQASCLSENWYSGREGYTQVGLLLNKAPGYYDLGVAIQNQQGEVSAHNLGVCSRGHRHSLIIFDSNVGECKVSTGDFPYFMKELSQFYQATRGYAFIGVRSILTIEFTSDVGDTPLAQLAAELD